MSRKPGILPEWVVRLKTGDERAFTEIYNLLSAQIYTNVLKMTKDEHVAEEIVQEVFTKVWNGREKINVEHPFDSYLYRISQNLVMDYYRQVKQDKALYTNFQALATEYYTHVEEFLHQKENQEIFQKAICTLSPQQQKVYQLCKIDGFTYKEAAEEMNISHHTVKEYLSAANRSVKDYILTNMDTTLGLVICAVLYS